jgi:lysophospholipase L1-like esterase
VKKKKFLAGITLAAMLLLSGCAWGQQSSPYDSEGQQSSSYDSEAGQSSLFYDKVIEDFGVLKNVEAYTVNDSVSAFNESAIRYHGRYYRDEGNQAVWISFTNAGFEVTFQGTTLEGDFLATNADDIKNKPYVAVTVDGDYDPDHATAVGFTDGGTYNNATGTQNGFTKHEHVVLAHGLDYGWHTVRIYKRSECLNSRLALLQLATDGEISEKVQAKELSLKMEVYGDSVTCGYAVESDDRYENFTTRTENGMKTYANYAANLLNSDISSVSAGGYPLYRSRWSENNTPSTVPDFFSRAEIAYQTNFDHAWDNSKYIPDVVVIALGANDISILNQLEENGKEYNDFLENFEKSYYAFFDRIYEAYPNTLIVVSEEILDLHPAFTAIADKVTEDYRAQGKKIVRAKYDAQSLAKDRTMPGDGHPNAEMQKIAGYELARVIANELNITIDEGNFWDDYQ